MLKTLTPEHKELRLISIYVSIGGYVDTRRGIQAGIPSWWGDLDLTLVRLWESNAVATRIMYTARRVGPGAREYVEQSLPEMTRRGIVELVECNDFS